MELVRTTKLAESVRLREAADSLVQLQQQQGIIINGNMCSRGIQTVLYVNSAEAQTDPVPQIDSVTVETHTDCHNNIKIERRN